MLKHSVSSVGKVCINNKKFTTFTIKTKSHELKKFRVMQLPTHRYEEYIDCRMKYYVKYEITHQIAGIPDSEEAMQEYKEIMYKTCKDPSVSNVICCLDNEDNEIVGISTQKLIKRGDREEEIKPRTKPVKRFYEILRTWNNLFPIPELMKNFNLTTYCDDMGFAIHPQYSGIGLANKMAPFRREVCKLQGAPMTGAWMTSPGTKNACARDGWEVIYEISYEELGRILGIKFENAPPSCAYMISKI
ncbi:uncharacterized protein LOC115443606 [Manduca sexta]|uniref:uncharacterized protein LOC115443606 n=1 Tax=Manduca sexta TaxID=7130 RepID=UPI0018907C50|nr:uncharacterized protein LOC115443606 [Manduca sexta]